MVRVRVVEANYVFATIAAFALDADQFPGIDVVAVVGGVGAGVATPRRTGHHTGAILGEAAQKNPAAFVRVGFFSVGADCVVVSAGKFQHYGSTSIKVKIPTLPQKTREGWAPGRMDALAFSTLCPEALA